MAVFCKNVDLHVPVCVEYIQTTLSLPIAWSCYFNSKPLPRECVCVCVCVGGSLLLCVPNIQDTFG